ncbi:MAG TPA: GxGYxYP domain-containing protein [Verrucomicrobiae bacterium]|nr:GxGYxYP domain-containing protein [Verrucomicrobiae bacterium]
MESKPILLLVSLFTSLALLSPSVLANDDAPKVAVLVEKGLVPVGGTPALPPSKIVEVLRQYGIEAEPLSAAELSDYAVLNTQRYAVLVMAYGNGFPKSTLKTIRAYHAAGGCLVMNGVPFCHPCDKVNGTWTDLGHVSYFGHDASGVGTGGFGGPLPREKKPLATIPGHPLGLTEDMLPSSDGSLQWLDPRSFPPEDEVIPLVNVGVGNEQHPAAAVIRHHCASFRGARDVWIGQVAQELDDQNRYFAEQLVIRGVLWCLLEKQQITKSMFAEELKALDAVQKPKPFPENLPYSVTPRPWGDSFLPKSKLHARHLLVVNVEQLSGEERIAITCLQGLTSREQPRIWIQQDQEDRTWLDWHKEKGYIDSYEVVANWEDLFKEFSSAYKGAVIPDLKLYRGDLLAVDVAECEDLIVATPELAKKLGLPVKIDLRGRFKTYVEGMHWVWTNYQSQLSHHLCRFTYPPTLTDCSFAYDFQWHSVMLWVAGPVDEVKPGADSFAERRLIAQIFSEMDPNIAVLGFPYGGTGVGMGEGDGVALASRYAKGLVCSDYLRNTCVMSGVRIDELAQRQQPPAPPLNKNSIYIALVMSDGDNENAWLGVYRQCFLDPSFGKFPLAYGMGPPIRELMPAVAQWFYEHATPETEFIADVSGVAYTQVRNYGLAYADRQRVLGGFLDRTSRSMQAMGMRTVRTSDSDDELNTRYAQALPFCHSIFAGMGHEWDRADRQGIEKLTYSLPDGMPIFYNVSTWDHGADGFLPEVREQVGSNRPVFVNGFVGGFSSPSLILAKIYDKRDPDMVFVTPAQLATLYRQARDKGWVK